MAAHYLLLFNATIHTMDTSKPEASSICIFNGTFAAVGSLTEASAACQGAQPIDLGGATITPGLTDSHAHLTMEGFKRIRPVLDTCNSTAAVTQLLTEWVASHPLAAGEWLQGDGWDQNLWVRCREWAGAAHPAC